MSPPINEGPELTQRGLRLIDYSDLVPDMSSVRIIYLCPLLMVISGELCQVDFRFALCRVQVIAEFRLQEESVSRHFLWVNYVA